MCINYVYTSKSSTWTERASGLNPDWTIQVGSGRRFYKSIQSIRFLDQPIEIQVNSGQKLKKPEEKNEKKRTKDSLLL